MAPKAARKALDALPFVSFTPLTHPIKPDILTARYSHFATRVHFF